VKKLSPLNKIAFALNVLFAVLLLFSYVFPSIPPTTSPTIAVLSLMIPVLIFVNVLFLLYWLLKLKVQLFLSLFVLFVGLKNINTLYQFVEKKVLLTDDIKLMSYNVRLFNAYKWTDEKGIKENILKFISDRDPDILAIQEFYNAEASKFDHYPYKYLQGLPGSKKVVQTIFSKYEIVNKGSLVFNSNGNNTIFVDVVKGKDTIRIYNIHLASFNINPESVDFGQENSEKLFKRAKKVFQKQLPQVEKILAHQKKCPYKVILMGDFNNTAFSWAYKKLKKGKKDAFIEAGQGFQKTYNHAFPLRIDFIFVDESIAVNHFKTYNVAYSDHFPILARVRL